MPLPGAIDASFIWYQLMALTGAFVSALAPVCAVARLASARCRPRVPAIVAAGADASHWYRLKQQLVLFARIFGLFSSSVHR